MVIDSYCFRRESSTVMEKITADDFSLDKDCHHYVARDVLPKEEQDLIFDSSKKDSIRTIHNIVNRWEGIVEEKSEDVIYARMYDYEKQNEDLAELHRSNFPTAFNDPDVSVGSLFYLYVGYTESPYRSQAAIIKFRPMPSLNLTKDDYNKVLDRIVANKKRLNTITNEQTECY